jgi:hypothetical protein
MKEQQPVSGLDNLLGLSAGNTTADLGSYRYLKRLKSAETLSDDAVARGFTDLLQRRDAARVQVVPRRSPWWGYGAAAAVAVVAVSAFLLLRTSGPKTAEILTADSGAKIKAEGVSFPEQKLVAAKIEAVDLKIRGVSGFSAQSTASELLIRFDSGFLNIEYHPGAERKKLILQVRDTTFTVTGTKFFVQAGNDVRLVVTEGSVAAKSRERSVVVSTAETWTPAALAVRKLTPIETETYVRNFSDTAQKPAEITLPDPDAKPQPDAGKKRVKVYLNLGQVVSGSLAGEDAETVTISVTGGKVVKISRQEIEKIERLP